MHLRSRCQDEKSASSLPASRIFHRTREYSWYLPENTSLLDRALFEWLEKFCFPKLFPTHQLHTAVCIVLRCFRVYACDLPIFLVHSYLVSFMFSTQDTEFLVLLLKTHFSPTFLNIFCHSTLYLSPLNSVRRIERTPYTSTFYS